LLSAGEEERISSNVERKDDSEGESTGPGGGEVSPRREGKSLLQKGCRSLSGERRDPRCKGVVFAAKALNGEKGPPRPLPKKPPPW